MGICVGLNLSQQCVLPYIYITGHRAIILLLGYFHLEKQNVPRGKSKFKYM